MERTPKLSFFFYFLSYIRAQNNKIDPHVVVVVTVNLHHTGFSTKYIATKGASQCKDVLRV